MAGEVDLFARNLRRYRAEAGLSIGELARKAGLSKQTLSVLEQGEGNPTLGTVAAVAESLGVSTRAMLTELGSPVHVGRASAVEWAAAGDGVTTRRLHRGTASEYVSTTVLRLDSGVTITGAPRPRGSLYQAFMLTGRMAAGPVTDVVEVGEGDFLRFPSDVPHLFRAVGGETTAHLVATYPRIRQ